MRWAQGPSSRAAELRKEALKGTMFMLPIQSSQSQGYPFVKSMPVTMHSSMMPSYSRSTAARTMKDFDEGDDGCGFPAASGCFSPPPVTRVLGVEAVAGSSS